MTTEEIRKHHYERLNSYWDSAEYAEHARAIGKATPEANLPSLLGQRWEINRDIYWEFLEMMPPLEHRNGSFYMSEFSFGDITAKFTREGDRYFCEFARYPARAQGAEWADRIRESGESSRGIL